MTDVQVPQVPAEVTEAPVSETPKPVAPPIRSRFLFVDVAAQRAKQLRRGAKPRLNGPDLPHKLERVAMREVEEGLIEWSLPPFKGAPPEDVPV